MLAQKSCERTITKEALGMVVSGDEMREIKAFGEERYTLAIDSFGDCDAEEILVRGADDIICLPE